MTKNIYRSLVSLCRLDNAQYLVCFDCFSSQTPSSGKKFFLLNANVGGETHPTLPPCSGVLVCLSVLPAAPPPIQCVLSKGQFLWTQTKVLLALPKLEMHSTILSCVSASQTGCQTCGSYVLFIFLSFFLWVSNWVGEDGNICGWWYRAYNLVQVKIIMPSVLLQCPIKLIIKILKNKYHYGNRHIRPSYKDTWTHSVKNILIL